MALVVLPEGQQRSGKQGGMVWSHNRAGAYTRARSIPVNPRTYRQTVVRDAIENLMIAWVNDLTAVQRAAWEAYAAAVAWKSKLGQTISLTGNQMYSRSNTVIMQCGFPRVDDGPAILTLPSIPLVLSGAGSEATQLVTVTFDNNEAWAKEVGGHLHLLLGTPISPTRNFFNGPWRYLGRVDGAVVPPVSPKTFATPWVLTAGQKSVLRARAVRADGRVSLDTRRTFLAAA